jgi:transposase
MKLLTEIGPDVSRFASVKHFCSWLGLCPGTKISGGKVLSSGTKRSARGLLRVEKEQGRYRLFDRQSPQQAAGGELLPVFRNGNLLVDASLAEIRERLMASWVPDSISSSDLIEA